MLRGGGKPAAIHALSVKADKFSFAGDSAFAKDCRGMHFPARDFPDSRLKFGRSH
jgi:hypothetical protein